MGEQHHKYTGILILIFSLLVLLSAIFFTVSQSKVSGINEYKAGNSKLKSAKDNLTVAYILGYIAAAIGIILSILYFGHVAWGIKSEIPHLIVFILLFLLVIVSGIFGFMALSHISDSNASNKNGSEGWIWGALISALIGLIILIISGAWRAQYRSSKGAIEKAGQTFMEPSGAQFQPQAPVCSQTMAPQVIPQSSQTVTYTYVPGQTYIPAQSYSPGQTYAGQNYV